MSVDRAESAERSRQTSARARRGLLVAACLGALVLAACTPAAAPAPAPAPKPAGAPAKRGQPPSANACSTSVTTAEGKTQYFAMVDDGSGPPDAVTFDAASPAEKQADVAQIEATDGNVVAVEPDQVVTTEGFVNTPGDDPRFGSQWGVSAAGFPAAWTASGTQGSSVKVAVLDTGVYAAHEDLGLGTAVLPGFDEIDGSTVDGTSDPGGHGTHAAGIVGARDNTVGGVGGAPDVQIIPVRVLNAQGSGFYSDVIDGINHARTSGAKVISMSLGGAPFSQSLQDTVTTAVNAGVVLVAAAGNAGTCEVLYPAGLTGVISVAATQQAGLGLASYSGRGSWVDIAAPGDLIDSTLNGTSSSYGQLSGTSMATPFVSAAAALLIAKCPGITPATVESRLVSTVSPQIAGIRAGSGELRADLAIAGPC